VLKWTSNAEVIAKRSFPLSFEKEEKYSKNGLKGIIWEITLEKGKREGLRLKAGDPRSVISGVSSRR